MAKESDLTRIGATPMAEPINRCLEIDDGAGNRWMAALAGERMLIGRASDAQVKLNATGMSRRHAELFTDPFGRWWIRDLGSANGTLVNGFRIEERMLELGDMMQVGDATLVVAVPDARLHKAEPTPVAPQMNVSDSRSGGISTLSRGAEPKIKASHLTTLMGFSRRLQQVDNLGQRLRQLCSLMVSEQFGGRSAVVIRLKRKDASRPPQTLCAPQTAKDWDDDALYVTKAMLEAMRDNPEAMLAGDVEVDAGGVNEAATPEAAAMSAMVCPLRTTDDEVDMLYIMVPPSHGTMEWLTLASLAAEQFCQMELNWAARRQTRVSALIEHDLQRGRDIQQRLIPKDVEVAGLDVEMSFLPCRWVAGDYVDVIPHPKTPTKVLLIIADVCGKGLPAALVTSSLHTMVHTCMRAGASLLGLVTLMNEHLYQHLPANRFVTGIFMEMDTQSGEVNYINAGHPAPRVFASDGARRQMEMGDYEPLGLTRTKFSLLADQIDPCHMMMMYTDGLTELKDQSGRMLTTDRLGDHMQQIWQRDPTEPLSTMADDMNKVLNEYQGDRMQLDDRTFMMVRRQ